MWTWSGSAFNGEWLDPQGIDLSTYDEQGLLDSVTVYHPYEDAEVRLRINRGNEEARAAQASRDAEAVSGSHTDMTTVPSEQPDQRLVDTVDVSMDSSPDVHDRGFHNGQPPAAWILIETSSHAQPPARTGCESGQSSALRGWARSTVPCS